MTKELRFGSEAAPRFMVDGEPLTLEPMVVTTPFWVPSASQSQPAPAGAGPDNSRIVRDTTLADVGYTARKQAGTGFFIDGNQIDPHANAFSELIRVAPGFRIAPAADGRAYVISDAQNAGGGCVNFFVDGVRWQTIMPGDIDTEVRPAQVVAVEAYRSSSTPRQFAPDNQDRCATIVVWTRARVRPD